MDKVLDKLGVYDLIGVLLTGIIISLFTIRILIFFDWNLVIETTDSFQFLVISYFVGLVFQELGSKLNSVNILKSIFKTTNDLQASLSQKEINFYQTTIYEKLNFDLSDDNSIVEIYDYCKSFLNDKDSIKQDRKKSLGGMARSLSIYFLFLFFYSSSFLLNVINGILYLLLLLCYLYIYFTTDM